MEKSKQIPQLIAIIGAGVAGLGAAWKLSANPKVMVTIFEKSQTISGRAATRRKTGYFFDNGANYFTTDNKELEELVNEKFSENLIKIEKPIWTFEESGEIKQGDSERNKKSKYNYKEGIKSFAKLVNKEIQGKANIYLNKRIEKIDKIQDNNLEKLKLISTDNEELGLFDMVILTPPAIQIYDILKNSNLQNEKDSMDLCEHFQKCNYLSIISVILAFENFKEKEYYALLNSDRKHNISWLSFENDKEGHIPKGETVMVAQMANEWSVNNYDKNEGDIINDVLSQVKELFPNEGLEKNFKWGDVKKWKYALPTKPVDDSVFDIGRKHKLFFAGDFVKGKGRVLDSFEQGLLVGNTINKIIDDSSRNL